MSGKYEAQGKNNGQEVREKAKPEDLKYHRERSENNRLKKSERQ